MTGTASAARKLPAQQRSRERVERILIVASDAIAMTGSDSLRMSDVAQRAGISIGSLYQYFPDKSAVLRTLAERYNAESRRCIAEALKGADGRDALLAAFAGLVDTYYGIMLAEPVMRDIWSGMQADKQLAALQLAESRACGALLADAIRRVRPGADLDAAALLIWECGETAVRLAIGAPPAEGAAVIEAYKRMSLAEIARLTR